MFHRQALKPQGDDMNAPAPRSNVLKGTQISCMLPVIDMERARRFYDDARALALRAAHGHHAAGAEVEALRRVRRRAGTRRSGAS